MKDLTKGYPAKVIILFALPIMFGSIFQTLYNLCDSMIVSNYINSDALASVGATAVVSNTLIGFINGLTQGLAIPVARYFGAKDTPSIKRNIAQSFIITFVSAIVITVLSLILIKPVLVLLNTPDELMESSLTYVNIILAGIIFTALYNSCANILRALGNSRTPLYFLMVAVVINIGLDLLFIRVFDMGIAGAAYATIISQFISGALTLTYMIVKYKSILPGKGDWKIISADISELIPSGLAMALMGCIVNIGTVILQSGINGLGNTIITAHTASRRIFDILTVFLYTVGIGMTTYVSQNIGAKKLDRVKTGIRQAIIITMCETVILITICFIFGKSLIIWITGSTDPELLKNSVMYIRISSLNFFWLGPLFILRCSMQGMGRKIVPLISSGIELTCKIMSVLILTPLWGYLGIAITEPISWFLCTALLTIMYLTKKPEKMYPELC